MDVSKSNIFTSTFFLSSPPKTIEYPPDIDTLYEENKLKNKIFLM